MYPNKVLWYGTSWAMHWNRVAYWYDEPMVDRVAYNLKRGIHVTYHIGEWKDGETHSIPSFIVFSHANLSESNWPIVCLEQFAMEFYRIHEVVNYVMGCLHFYLSPWHLSSWCWNCALFIPDMECCVIGFALRFICRFGVFFHISLFVVLSWDAHGM